MTDKIFIVEDDVGILEAMDILLTESGYTVATEADARNVVVKIKKNKPDLVLLDMLMSGVDGRDVCTEIKNDKVLKDLPVVIISAHPSAHESVFHYGADDFLAKPFEVNDLLKIINKHLGKRKNGGKSNV